MDSIIGGLANFKVDTVLSAVDKYVPGAQNKIKNVVDKAKAYVNNVSELEMKVLEATNHEPWGPHGQVMQEITNSSFNSEGFYQIMGICDQRLSEGPENWRLVYKTLLLLEFMCKHGPLSVIEALSSYSRMAQLEKLRDRFEYKDPAGRDQGINVRQRAGALVTLVQDKDKLREERDKAAKNKSKYTGVSSSNMRYGGFSGSSSSSDYNTSSSYSSSSKEYGTSRDFGSSTSTAAPSYNRSSSGGTGGSSGGFGSSTAAAVPADPVEATKQRIARLREEGFIGSEAAAAGDGGSADGVGPGLESPTAAKRQPKKLSQIKIDPSISAAFAKGGLAPPPGSTKAAGASAGGAAAAAPASSGIDLLGDLDVPAQPPVAAAAASSNAADDWDGFADAAAAPAAAAVAGSDDWSAFDSAPTGAIKQSAAASQQKGPIDINALLGPLPTSVPAAGKAPLALDDFGMPVAAAPAAAAAADPFGPFVAPPAAAGKPSAAASASSSNAFGQDPFGSANSDPFAGSSFSSAPPAAAAGATANGGFGDPFAASGVVHMVPQASKQQAAAAAGPKLGPETAKAKDPFADLALI